MRDISSAFESDLYGVSGCVGAGAVSVAGMVGFELLPGLDGIGSIDFECPIIRERPHASEPLFYPADWGKFAASFGR
jgi:hypothetical protein